MTRDDVIDRLHRAHEAAAASIAEFGVPDPEREEAVERALAAYIALGPDPEAEPPRPSAPVERTADLAPLLALAEEWEREHARWATHHTQRQRAVSAVNRDHAKALRAAVARLSPGDADSLQEWDCAPCRFWVGRRCEKHRVLVGTEGCPDFAERLSPGDATRGIPVCPCSACGHSHSADSDGGPGPCRRDDCRCATWVGPASPREEGLRAAVEALVHGPRPTLDEWLDPHGRAGLVRAALSPGSGSAAGAGGEVPCRSDGTGLGRETCDCPKHSASAATAKEDHRG